MNILLPFHQLTASGPIAVFLLFLLPWGPGAIAGIILGRNDGLGPLLITGLYVLSDVVLAFILEPIVRFIRRRGDRSTFGQRFFEQIERTTAAFQVTRGRIGRPMSLFTLCFATDFFTASFASLALPIWRPIAWTAIIAGDVIWFLLILAATYGIASFLSDDRLLFVGSLVIGLVLPPLIRRLIARFKAAPNNSTV